MNKEQATQDDQLIDLGAATEETHGGPVGFFADSPQPRAQLGILVD